MMDKPGHIDLAEIYYYRGRAHQEFWSYQDALSDFNQAIRIAHEPTSEYYLSRTGSSMFDEL